MTNHQYFITIIKWLWHQAPNIIAFFATMNWITDILSSIRKLQGLAKALSTLSSYIYTIIFAKHKVLFCIGTYNHFYQIYDKADSDVSEGYIRSTVQAISLHDAESKELIKSLSQKFGMPLPKATSARVFYGFSDTLLPNKILQPPPTLPSLRETDTEDRIKVENDDQFQAIIWKQTKNNGSNINVDFCFAGLSGADTLDSTKLFQKQITMIGRIYGSKDYFIGLERDSSSMVIKRMSESQCWLRHHTWGRYYRQNYWNGERLKSELDQVTLCISATTNESKIETSGCSMSSVDSALICPTPITTQSIAPHEN